MLADGYSEERWNTRIEATANVEPDWWLYQSKSSDSWFTQRNRANMDRRYWTETALCSHPSARITDDKDRGPVEGVHTTQALLQEALTELKHCAVFVRTREKMHPDGVQLYDELIAKIERELGA